VDRPLSRNARDLVQLPKQFALKRDLFELALID
jgi:hypothetical protein